MAYTPNPTWVDGTTKITADTMNHLEAGIESFATVADAAKAVTDRVIIGTGNPETVVTATPGTIFIRTDGGTNTSLYVKESGSSTTNWTAI